MIYPFVLALVFDTAPPDQNALVLIKQLDHPKYLVRQQATADLIKMKLRAWSTVRRVTPASLETRQRLRQITRVLVEYELDCLEPFPWLDSLWYSTTVKAYTIDDIFAPSDLLNNFAKYRGYLRMASCDGSFPWLRHRLATRLMIRDRLLAGDSILELLPILDEMRRRDVVFLEVYLSQNPVSRNQPLYPKIKK